jgi:hypothetical protein
LIDIGKAKIEVEGDYYGDSPPWEIRHRWKLTFDFTLWRLRCHYRCPL